MRKMHLLALAAGALLATGSAAQMAATANPDETRRAIMRLECDWGRAYLRADVDALRRIEADDFVEVLSDGTMSNRQEEIDALSSGRLKFTQMVDGPMQVRVYGNTAIATGRSMAAGTDEGKPFSGTYAWIDTWMLRDGRWQIVAEGVSKVSAENAALQHVDGQCEGM
ncbi:MAG TPA: nuclear transport factor 2 family protein [Longimicrobiaceae bacterium]